MSIHILLNGKKSQKYINNEIQDVVPFIAAQTNDLSSELGIGIHMINSDKKLFWGLLSPHPIIQTWRGMKALEQLNKVQDNTLCACWHIANCDSCDDIYCSNLFKGFFKRYKMLSLRNKILHMTPEIQELDQIISTMLKNNIPIDAWELQRELSAGYITFTTTIQKVLT
jgi:hypothetical protein